MKHIRFQFLTLLSATALTLTSCDLIGSLDGIEPEHVVTDDNYITDVEGTKRSVYLRESPKIVEEPRIEIVR